MGRVQCLCLCVLVDMYSRLFGPHRLHCPSCCKMRLNSLREPTPLFHQYVFFRVVVVTISSTHVLVVLNSLQPPPGAYLRDCLESYLRGSTETLPIQIYRIECWESANNRGSASSDQYVPFIARLEISARVEARHYQRTTRDQRKLQEIIKQVNLPLPQLRISYTKMNLAEERSGSVNHDDLVFDGVVLSNVPISKDPCFPASPCKPWLEMYAQIHGSASSKKSKSASSEQRSRVALVDISSPVPFSILVDTTVFGPFYRIVICPENITFPLQTFFPIPQD